VRTLCSLLSLTHTTLNNTGQLEHKYQHDLEEARRGAEALASHCAAQSSLIATLKREVAQSAGVLVDQKVIVQRVEAKSAADLELAQKDISHLHARIVELSDEKKALRAQIESINVTVANLKGAAAVAVAESQAADDARASSLDSYARQLVASRFLLKKWRGELNQRRAAELSFDKVRTPALLRLNIFLPPHGFTPHPPYVVYRLGLRKQRRRSAP